MNDTPNSPSPEDPMITAYALGELDPQSAEYQAIEAKLADDPQLREQVEQIAQLGSQLSASYAQSAGPGLDDDALSNIIDASDAPVARIRPKAPLTRRLLPYAGVAACAVLAASVYFVVTQSDKANPFAIASNQENATADAEVSEAPVILNIPLYALDTPASPGQIAEPTVGISPNYSGNYGSPPTTTIPDSLAFSRTVNAPETQAPVALGSNYAPQQSPLPNYRYQSGAALSGTTKLSDKPAIIGGRNEPAIDGDPNLRALGDERLARVVQRRLVDEKSHAVATEKQKLQQIQSLLRSARQHQESKQFDQALTQLKTALVLEPENEDLKSLEQMINDHVAQTQKHKLEKVRDLKAEQFADQAVNGIDRRLIVIDRERIQIEQEQRERFAEMNDNPFKRAADEPLSTFSVDVDTASYTYGRRAILTDLTLPPANSVRIEEWINYFDYGYTAPVVDPDQLPNGRLTTAALEKLEAADGSFVPFATDVEVTQCPWAKGNQLVRIGIQAMDVQQDDRPPAHLVFLLDVSGSMNRHDKLPLVQQGMPMLLEHLNDNDKVSIVVYAGASGLVLEAAEAADKGRIQEAIAQLRAGGSTAGAAGIQLAYDMAEKHFVTGGVNRIILCTDGDFNVGTSNTDELIDLVKAKANPARGDGESNKGVYLSVMGFGTGNLNDEMMEKITNAGNGNYHYIDSVNEAVKTLSSQVGGTLVTVAKDVKLQLEFNPAQVASYRLIGYENRVLANEDFNNDTVDAGDIGAGHSVTALYEIVPVQGEADKIEPKDPAVDELRYQEARGLAEAARLPELLTLKLRYKPVDAAAEQGTSRKVVKHVPVGAAPFAKASEATRFASSVAAMGMILRGSKHCGQATPQWVLDTAIEAKTHDPNGYREEFCKLATQVGIIQAQRDEAFRKDLVD